VPDTSILRRSIEEHCGIPVLGAIPKLRQQSFPERHMGLVPTPEHGWAKASIDASGSGGARAYRSRGRDPHGA
jgi:cobyrinic acid a,c-diamide synthase